MGKKNKETESSKASGRPQMPAPGEVAPTARRIMRLASKVAMATIDKQGRGKEEGNAPFLSLTGVATLMDAMPVLLLSDISRHTQNLRENASVSLLFDGTGGRANPLTEDRITVNGRITRTQNPEAEPRFMAAHPKAFYAGFADFSFYEMQVTDAHFVGGFGTALTLAPQDLLLPRKQLVDLLASEVEILNHMNEQYSESICQMAVTIGKAKEGAWRISGVDPEGFDLSLKGQRLRLSFPSLATNAQKAREMLLTMAKTAR
jgi:putative heme iron utilization protein